MVTKDTIENEYKSLYSGNDEAFNELFDNFWGIIIEDCYPDFKSVILKNFKSFLSTKLDRSLTNDEVLTIVKSQLDGISFNFNDCL